MKNKPVGLRSRNEDEKRQRQRQILDAALLEFDEHGYEKTTMSGIARRSGLSRSLVNFYFGDKAGIHNAIEQVAIEQLGVMLNQATVERRDGLDQLMAMVRAFVVFHQEYPGYFEALAREDESETAEIPLEKSSQEVMEIIAQTIETGMGDGSISHDFPNSLEAALTLWSISYGSILLTERKERLLKHHWKVKEDTLLRGLETVVKSAFQGRLE